MSGPLPDVLAPVAAPAAWLYGLGVRRRNARYDTGRGVRTIDRPVISVGNITTGGVGKSPMVRWICRHLQTQERTPCIAMRGYAGGEQSDEVLEYRATLPDTPLVVDPDRAGALDAFLPDHPEIDCVVLDDGFQHRALARDLDLVLIDATRDTMRDRLLPAGHLREPIENLRRADAVIITRAEGPDDTLSAAVERAHGAPPLAWCRHRWTGVDWHAHGTCETRTVDTLRDRRVATMTGVGNPAAIVRQLEACGAAVVVQQPARDHERYTGADVRAALIAASAADALVVTMKDWVKLARHQALLDAGPPVAVLRVDIEFTAGESALVDRLVQV